MAILYVLGFAMMAGVSYLAVSKKSELKVRFAALGALGVMIVTVIICMVIYFRAAAAPTQLFLPDMMPSDMPPPVKTNPVTMIMTVVLMIALFAVVFFLAMKEQKRAEGKEPPPISDW